MKCHFARGGLLLGLFLLACDGSEPVASGGGGAGGEGPGGGGGAALGGVGGGLSGSGGSVLGGVGGGLSGSGGAALGGVGGGLSGSGGEPMIGGSGGAPSGGGSGGTETGGSGGTETGGSGGTETGGSGGTETGGSGGALSPACGSHKWACWRMPNPPGTGPNEASYTVSDGVVHDDVTGLDWEQTPPDSSYTVDAALAYCESLSLGGHDDWRLPTRVEMSSIMDWTRSPAIDPAFTARSGFHKTGSNWVLTIDQRGAGAGTDYAWAFNMSDGIVSNAYSAATAARLRCVRGHGPGEGFNDKAVAPAGQYTEIDAAQVLDNYTQLVWERDGDGSGPVTWTEARAYCEALDLGGRSDWRLPTIRELATLVDEALVAPSIHRTMFPNTHYGSRSNNWYWASHNSRGSTTYAWALNFDDGFTGFNSGAAAWNTFTSGYAKCVRAP